MSDCWGGRPSLRSVSAERSAPLARGDPHPKSSWDPTKRFLQSKKETGPNISRPAASRGSYWWFYMFLCIIFLRCDLTSCFYNQVRLFLLFWVWRFQTANGGSQDGRRTLCSLQTPEANWFVIVDHGNRSWLKNYFQVFKSELIWMSTVTSGWGINGHLPQTVYTE